MPVNGRRGPTLSVIVRDDELECDIAEPSAAPASHQAADQNPRRV